MGAYSFLFTVKIIVRRPPYKLYHDYHTRVRRPSDGCATAVARAPFLQFLVKHVQQLLRRSGISCGIYRKTGIRKPVDKAHHNTPQRVGYGVNIRLGIAQMDNNKGQTVHQCKLRDVAPTKPVAPVDVKITVVKPDIPEQM